MRVINIDSIIQIKFGVDNVENVRWKNLSLNNHMFCLPSEPVFLSRYSYSIILDSNSPKGFYISMYI